MRPISKMAVISIQVNSIFNIFTTFGFELQPNSQFRKFFRATFCPLNTERYNVGRIRKHTDTDESLLC